MSGTLIALLLAAASPASSETVVAPVTAPVVDDDVGIADAAWSVGAGLGLGGAVATVERRIAGAL